MALRVNGFVRPYSTLQLISWVATALLVFGFFGWQLPFLDGAAAAALAVLYVLVAGSVVGLAALITRSNPADPAVKALLAQAKGEGAAPPPQPAYNAERPFCDYCKTCVAPRTKHCRACDKCVEDFDHHCKWLNNCIGGQNYSQFVALIAAVFAMTFGQAVLTGWQFALYSRSNLAAPFADHAAVVGEVFGSGGLLAGIVVVCIVATLFAVAVAHLLIFHMYLRCRRLSTYEYILEGRRKREEEEEAKEEEAITQGQAEKEDQEEVEEEQEKGAVSQSLLIDESVRVSPMPWAEGESIQPPGRLPGAEGTEPADPSEQP